MALLEVDNVSVNYGAVRVLHGVSLRVEQAGIVTILGANGAGKSTTLRTISGLLRPSEGQIAFEGRPITGVKPHEIARMGIAHVPEGRGIFSGFTVQENLAMGHYSQRVSRNISDDYERVLDLFPRLRQRLKQNAGTLSGGEQQMLAIARALLSNPKLLLLDEPSLGLAPQLVSLIFQIIQRINQAGTTVLLVEQNAHRALEVAHEGYVMEVGRIVLHRDAAALAASDDVRKAYLGVA